MPTALDSATHNGVTTIIFQEAQMGTSVQNTIASPRPTVASTKSVFYCHNFIGVHSNITTYMALCPGAFGSIFLQQMIVNHLSMLLAYMEAEEHFKQATLSPTCLRSSSWRRHWAEAQGSCWKEKAGGKVFCVGQRECGACVSLEEILKR